MKITFYMRIVLHMGAMDEAHLRRVLRYVRLVVDRAIE